MQNWLLSMTLDLCVMPANEVLTMTQVFFVADDYFEHGNFTPLGTESEWRISPKLVKFTDEFLPLEIKAERKERENK